MDDLDRALQAASMASLEPAVKESLIHFLDELKRSSDGWKALLMKLFATKDMKVKLTSLTLIHEIVMMRFALSPSSSSSRCAFFAIPSQFDLVTRFACIVNSFTYLPFLVPRVSLFLLGFCVDVNAQIS